MGGRRPLLSALFLSLAVAAAAQLPYLVAARLASEGTVFAGFLINPIDGFSYLAKMRQGADGSWLFRLPYAADPGPGAFIYVYYLALGHLATVLSLPLTAAYGLARFAGAVGMYLAAFVFLRRALGPQGPFWPAFLITLLASGLGWLAIPIGLVTPDLWMPEVIPILSAYANAHFPLAVAALLTAAVAVMGGGEERPAVRFGLGLASGAVIGIVLPFVAVSLVAILMLWLAWEHFRGEPIRSRVAPFAGVVLGSAPWLVYDFWLSRAHPALAGWTAQNQTPSPPPYEFAIGYGLILLLAVLGAAWARPQDSAGGRLFLTWVIVNALLLYAPFGLQRRLSLGLFFPLAALAALGLQSLSTRAPARRAALAGVIILSLPSTLLVVGAGLGGVARGSPELVMMDGEAAAYEWAGDNLPPGALVLAGPMTGNRLPAFGDVRVLYGHPFETPDAQANLDLVERLYGGTMPITEALALLDALDVSYVFYGPHERALGSPGWLEGLERAYQAGDVVIYRVRRP